MDSEKQDLQQVKRQSVAAQKEADDYLAELRDRRASLGATGSGASSSRGTSGRAAPQPPWRAAQYPKALPSFAQTFSVSEFERLLPPGIKVSKESFHGRCRLFWREGPRRSRSAGWDLHGWEGSIRLLLRHAWADYCKRTGFACPIPGVLRALGRFSSGAENAGLRIEDNGGGGGVLVA